MCNCSSAPETICHQCSQGNPCGCPPDYSILPQQVPCTCCPAGYTYNQSTKLCTDLTGSRVVSPVPCNTCPDSISSDCVIIPPVECLGLPVATTLTQFVNFLCSVTFIESILTRIGLNNTTLGVDFCQLVHACPSSGTGAPIIVYVTFSVP